jgi:hypothetical protein
LLSQGCSTYLQLVGTDLQFSNQPNPNPDCFL